jgi:cytoskeletal protein RodZ
MALAESSTTSLGGYLRSLREGKGSSLEDMARSTRVGIRHLEALEDERLTDLPSPVFVRGFIRAYCGFLRESPDEALARYEALAGERATAHAASALPAPRTNRTNSSVVVGLALLVILGVALLAVNLTVKRTRGTSVAAPNIEPQAVAKKASDPPAVVPAPAAPAAAPAPTPAPAPAAPTAPRAVATPPAPAPPAAATTPPATAGSASGTHRLLIRAVEATWIRVQPDEGRATEETLPAGASREWSAERRFVVTIGNAGGVEVTLNGKVLPPLGAKGAVIQRLELPQAPASGS